MFGKTTLLAALVLTSHLFAEDEFEFWSTGPLLVQPGDVIEFGHAVVEPYFNGFQYWGAYDSDWHFQRAPTYSTFLFQPYVRLGLAPGVELDVIPQLYYNHTEGAGKWAVGDTPLWLAFPLVQDHDWSPNVILEIVAVLPTGKCQHFNPLKKETDFTGLGSWFPGPGIVFYRDFHLWNSHFLSLCYSAIYGFGTPVRVRGLNAYGGDETTSGTVHPGDLFTTIFAFEFSLTQNWVFAMDTLYVHQNKSHFTGHTEEPVGGPSSEQISLAPAIEYLWNDSSGIVGGPWFSIAGRNSDQFFGVSIALYWSL